MALTLTNLGASTGTAQVNPDIRDINNLSSYVNTSWTPPTDADSLIMAFAMTGWTTGSGTMSMSGNGVTWTEVATMTYSNSAQGRRLSWFAGLAAGSSAGITTLTISAAAIFGYCMFTQLLGVDVSGGVAAAIVQGVNNTGTATSGSLTFASAGNAANRPIAGYLHEANESTTGRGASWTKIDDYNGAGPAIGGETQWRSDAFDTASSATWTTSAIWGGLGVEVKAKLAGVTLRPPAVVALRAVHRSAVW